MDDFTLEKRNVLSNEICQEIIRRFELDARKEPGTTAGGYHPEIKKSTDLMISALPEWKDIDKILFESLRPCIKEYTEKYDILASFNFMDNGYQIQRTLPGESYTWHSDVGGPSNLGKQATFIWYLNDVEEGETELFYYGVKVKPETGKLFMFPSFWTHTHRGNEPKNPKYIATGWLWARHSGSTSVKW